MSDPAVEAARQARRENKLSVKMDFALEAGARAALALRYGTYIAHSRATTPAATGAPCASTVWGRSTGRASRPNTSTRVRNWSRE